MDIDRDQMLKPKATLTFYSRSNDIAMANILRWWTDRNERVGSMSELARVAIETLSTILVHHQAVKPFDNNHEARMFLELHNLVKSTMTKKKKRTFHDSVRDSVMEEDHFEGNLKDKLIAGDAFHEKKQTKRNMTAKEFEIHAKTTREMEGLYSGNKPFSIPSDKPNEPNEGDLRDEGLATIPNDVKGGE